MTRFARPTRLWIVGGLIAAVLPLVGCPADKELVAIELDPPSGTIHAGSTDSLALTATGIYDDRSREDITARATWTSSNLAIATVDAMGVVHAGARAGNVEIIAALDGVQSQPANVLVRPESALARIEIEPAAAPPLAIGRTLPFHATGVYTDGTTMDLTASASLTWSSSDGSIASISNAPGSKGVATALAMGTTQIRAIFYDGTTTLGATPVMLVVSGAELVGVEVAPAFPRVPQGFDVAFFATGHYSDGSAADVTAAVTWSSSNDAIASISNAAGRRGVATGLAAGTAMISATLGALTDTTRLTVSPATLVSISVSPPAADVSIGGARALGARGNFSDGSTLDLTSTVTWAVDLADLGRGVTVSNATGRQGLVTVSASATPSADPVTISAMHGAITGLAQITIVGALTLVGIVVDVDEPVIPIGLTAQATARGMYSDGVHPSEAVDISYLVTWSPAVGGILTVSNAPGSKGRVTGVARGTDRINACLGAVCADDPGGHGSTATVRVTDCAFASIEIRPGGVSREIPRGTSRQFAAFALWAGDGAESGCEDLAGFGYDVTEHATWRSSNSTVATVSNAFGSRGLVTAAVAPPASTVDISASFGALIGTASMTILDACVERVTVMPASAVLPSGVRFAFTAMARLTDGRDVDYTDLASWSDEPAGFVGIVDHGVVQTYLAGGSETITATAAATSACPMRQGTARVTVDTARLTSITMEPSAPSVAVGDDVQLAATGHYSDGSSHVLTDLASWTSSNNDVATVVGGRVHGVAAGRVVVMATYSAVTGTASVNVGGRSVESIDVMPDSQVDCGTFAGAYPAGVLLPLRAFARYSDGSGPEDVTARVAWATSDATHVAVSATGFANMVSAGSADISAALEGVTGTLGMQVIASDLGSIAVEPGDGFVLPLSATRQFRAFGYYTASGFPEAERCEMTSLVTWAALPAASVGIDSAGLASTTAVPSASALVTATAGPVTGTAHGEVRGSCVSGLLLRPSAAITPLGVPQQFFAEAALSDGTTFDVTLDAATRWTSSNPSVASVSGGVARPLSAGDTAIFAVYDAGTSSCAMAGTFSASAQLVVTPASLASIFVSCSGIANWSATLTGIPAGVQIDCAATGTYSDGSTRNLTRVATWSSAGGAVASVSDAMASKGRVLGRAPGTATISAALGGVVGNRPLTVVGATLAGIDVYPRTTSLPVGFTEKFSATGRYSLGGVVQAYAITTLATWSSSAPTYVAVSDDPAAKGRATTLMVTLTPVAISAAYQGVTGNASLAVNDATLRSIEVIAPSGTLARGQVQRYTALGIYANGSGTYVREISGAVRWSTTNVAVASITPTGLATATGLGTVVVTAELAAASGSAPLTVEDECISQLEIVPSVYSLPSDVPVQFRVIAHLTAGAPQDVTDSAIFQTSDASRLAAPGPDGWTRSERDAIAGTVFLEASVMNGACTGLAPARATLNVTGARLTSIRVTSEDGPSLPVGLTVQFHAEGRYDDGSSYDITRTVDAWTTGSPAIATVSNAPGTRGIVTGVTAGRTPVVATQGSVSGSAEIVIGAAILTRIEVEGLRTLDGCFARTTDTSWAATGFSRPGGGYRTWVRAWGIFGDGSRMDVTSVVTWSSASPSRASVSNALGQHGRVATGPAFGPASLVATSASGLSGSITIDVVDARVDRLEINRGGEDPVRLAMGNAARLEVVGRFGGPYYCVTDDTAYVSSSPDVASVSNVEGSRGLVRSAGVGSTMVTAWSVGVTDTILITVGIPTLSFVAVNPPSAALRVGESAQLRAYAHYSDGMVNDITWNTGTSWTSSNELVAQLGSGAKGLVRAMGAGTATVDACMSGVCALTGARAAVVTVTP